MATSPPFPPLLRRSLRRSARWLALALAVALAAGVASRIDWSELAQRIVAARRGPLIAATALLLARYGLWAWRWNLAVRAIGVRAAPGALCAMVVGAAAVNHITPAAKLLGGLLRARYLGRRTPLSTGRAYGTVLFDQISHQVALTGLTTAAIIGAVWATGRTALAIALAVLASGLSLGLLRAFLRDRRKERDRRGSWLERKLLGRWTQRLGKARQTRFERWVERGRPVLDTLRELLRRRSLMLASLALGLAYAAVNAAAQWMFFAAVEAPTAYLVAFAAVALGTAAGALLGTPGGVGATEAAMIGTYVALGIDGGDAAAAALLYRGLHYATVFTVGGTSLLWLERSAARPSPEGWAPPDEEEALAAEEGVKPQAEAAPSPLKTNK
ncbi:MAG: lysylphosphatidylglycerol synthase transmembrane domain-containing protein [Acidobacteriota bacterium]